MYYAEGTHEPIIDQATFDKAQERLRMLAQQAANRKKPTRSVFSGLIHCRLCGNTYKRVKTVKLADLSHNSDLTRLDEINEAALNRVEKYKAAIKLLSEN